MSFSAVTKQISAVLCNKTNFIFKNLSSSNVNNTIGDIHCNLGASYQTSMTLTLIETAVINNQT